MRLTPELGRAVRGQAKLPRTSQAGPATGFWSLPGPWAPSGHRAVQGVAPRTSHCLDTPQ